MHFILIGFGEGIPEGADETLTFGFKGVMDRIEQIQLLHQAIYQSSSVYVRFDCN